MKLKKKQKKKYNNILRNNDVRLQSALEKISDKIGGNFNINKNIFRIKQIEIKN